MIRVFAIYILFSLMKMTQISASKFWTEGYSDNFLILFVLYELHYVSIAKLWNSRDHLSSKLTIRVKNISNTGVTTTTVKRRACVRDRFSPAVCQFPPQNFKGKLKRDNCLFQFWSTHSQKIIGLPSERSKWVTLI